jgi:gliding motility-associated-like protein
MNNYTLRKLHFFRLLLFGSLFLGSYQARAQFPYAESFKNSTAPGVSFGGNSISFLTGGAGPIAGGYNDPDGSGYLRLTNNSQSQRAYITSEGIVFPANFGLNISFEYFTFGGGGADGICFILYDGSISNPTIGEPGGSLSYAQGTGGPGFQGGYLGIGLDEWGNFSNPSEGRNGGPGQAPNSVALRGLGSGSSGYAYLTGVRTTSLVSPFSIAGGNRNATTSASSGYRKVELELKANPGGGYFISVYITNGATRTLVIGNYLDTQISPATMKFAISASTGGFTNYHEIRNLTFDVNDPNALVAPVANADSATSCAGIVTTFDILANDNGTVNAGGSVNTVAIDLDTSTAGIQTSKTVAGKGTFVYDSETGQVTFTPIDRLITGPVAIDYTFMDTYGQISNISTITYNIGNPPIVGNTVTAPGTSSFTCGNGDPANIVGSTTVTGGTGTFTYQWQKSIDNITFSDIAGATGIDYDPAPISITTYFRRITSSGSCSDSPGSNVVIITITNCIDAVIDSFPTQRPSTTVPTTVGNVTTNDTLNGIPVTTSNTDVTPVTAGPISIDATGVLTLAPNTPSGSYPITYTICEVDPVTGLAVVPSNCDSVTDTVVVLNPIDAVIDSFPTQRPSTTVPTTVGNVTTNDTLNGIPVTTSNTDVTPVTAGPISIDATGVLTLAPNTPSGSYPITYTICEVDPVTGLAVVPSNCDSVTDTVVVLNPIDAVIDSFPTQRPSTTVPTTVGNVTTNDTLNGIPVTTSNTDVTPVTAGPISIDATGVLTLAPNTPSGSYPITYTICEVDPVTGLAVVPSNCDSVTDTVVVLNPIDAVIDSFPTQRPSTTVPTTVGNVTTNDTLNGIPVTTSNTDVTPVTAGPISIDATGVLTLAPNTPSGSYPITYTICEVDPVTGLAVVPSNCDSVTDTVVVLNPIDAVIDSFPTQRPSTTVPTTVGNVTTNDTLNGIPVTTSNTDVTPVTAGPISIDATGVLTLAPNTPSGSYPITYTICEVDPVTGLAVVPSNCDSVTDTVVVLNPIDAVNDILLSSNGASGNPVAGHVLTNDSLNTKPADLTNVNLSVITVATPIGGGLVPVLDPASGIVNVPVGTPSGTYAITYQICEKASASNCDTAIVTIPVLASNITANDDTGIPVSGTIGGISFTNVLSNDTLNGVSVLASDVNITFVSATNPGVTLSGTDVLVAAGTPGGNYTLIYRICEKLNPTNCDEATVTIFVESPSMTISKDGTYMDNNSDGKTNVGDTIIYEFVVTNTGNVPLSNVTVTDNNAVVSGGPISLAVGASDSTTFTAVHTITQADIDAGIVYNSAITSATPPTGPPVMGTSTDPTPCATCPVNPACPTCTDTKTPLAQSPSIAISKDGTYMDNNSDGKTNVGDTIIYKFVVTNTGNVPLSNVTVTDNNAVVSGGPISLAVGASDSTTFTAVHTITQADIDAGIVYNSAITSATPPTGPPVMGTSTDPTPCATCPVNPACPTCTDTKTPLAQSPSIALVKTAVLIDENGDGLTQVGETIQYSFVLTNTGNVPLTNITIKDPLPGVVMSGGPISLLPGESDSTSFTGTYAVTVEDLSNGSVSNQAIATGTNPQGVVVKDLSGSNIVNDEPTVLTVEGCKVEVFNLVSPNGDGQNDSFYIEGLDCYATNAVEIYNRWGVLVYSAEDYNNKDVSFKGFSQGRATVKQSEGLPDGTYYYILKYTDLQNKALSKAGYLYLTK